MLPRVVILDDYQQAALSSADWSVLVARADVSVISTHIAEEDELVHRLAGADVVVAMRERTPFPATLLERLPDLKLLVTTAMVNASIDLNAARQLGIVVCGTGTTPSASTAAELTWALVLALMRRVTQENAAVRQGEWQLGIGRALEGSTLGLLGLGRIGQQVARFGQAFNMKVLAWSENLTADRAAEHGAILVTKPELFLQSDVVSVHLLLSSRTRGLVGASELTMLGSEGFLVNTSRGPIVDEAALVDALRVGAIAGAGLDVFDVEPLPRNHPLRSLNNVIVTPHIGYVTRQTYGIYYRDAVEDILGWLEDSPLRVL